MKIEDSLRLCRSIVTEAHPEPHIELVRDAYFADDESDNARGLAASFFEQEFDKIVEAFGAEWQSPHESEPGFALWRLPNGCQPFVELRLSDDSLALFVGVDVDSQLTG